MSFILSHGPSNFNHKEPIVMTYDLTKALKQLKSGDLQMIS